MRLNPWRLQRVQEKWEPVSVRTRDKASASYALILNPYEMIKFHLEHKTPGLRQDKFHALLERALEIGDESLSPDAEAPAESAAAAEPNQAAKSEAAA